MLPIFIPGFTRIRFYLDTFVIAQWVNRKHHSWIRLWVFELFVSIILSVFPRSQTSCPQLPTLSDIKLNNRYWQKTTNSYGNFYLYGAYLDNRERNRFGPSVRILGMIEPKNRTMRIKPYQQQWEGIRLYCQIWFRQKKPAIIAKVCIMINTL